jgi:hypothetical protein
VIAEAEEVGLDGHCHCWGRWMTKLLLVMDDAITTGGEHILDDATAANATS